MKRSYLNAVAVALAIALFQKSAVAQGDGHPKLHVNPKWKECSFQLDPSLTQAAWHQFTREAGLVAYFRSLSDARPMGKGNFEISLLQYDTRIDDHDAAWNDTFVHPDSAHWLTEGEGLTFPGLMMKAGVSNKTDVGLYLTKNFRANYGFVGAQVQRNLFESASQWAASARVSLVSMFGPADLNFRIYGADLLASRKVTLTRWAALSPYAGVSTYLASSHEKTSAVSLNDEHVLGAQGMLGAAVQLANARIAAEYSVASVSTFSLKVGIGR